MKTIRIEHIFRTLTAALMTMTVCGSLYLLRTAVHMQNVPAAALLHYHGLPVLTEHILAGLLFYVLLSVLFTKTAASGDSFV